ncbi:hypothetical protein T440DRAFT_472191 [Plenodomus tracheiphilus IPT5]|uniref:Uncharacterized protein n=1 Tax=Plenodomus tracheiphilus IPT5 TaxID=1408161 RepID=A0A6A7ASJ9_9PLEO|nr:hypothetical protein T440DRAFT_472191 [Plenodomus tracheiphilus IPT5]
MSNPLLTEIPQNKQGAKKFGGAQGQKISQNRAMSEKITDGMRKAYEKVTGKKVNSKFSN